MLLLSCQRVAESQPMVILKRMTWMDGSSGRSRLGALVAALLAAGFVTAGFSATTAHAQTDAEWLDEALARSALLSAPWVNANQNSANQKNANQKRLTSPSGASDSLAPRDAKKNESEGEEIPSVSVDVLSYPWPNEPAIKALEPAAVPPKPPVEVAHSAVIDPWDADSPSSVPTPSLLVDPWGDG